MEIIDRSQAKTTQRAYTLRLNGVPGDNTWKEHLWQTHEAVNKGARVFGDWLLTLRGGLSHELAYKKIQGAKGNPDREPTEDEIRDRRIVLALSWLSVESGYQGPEGFVVTRTDDDKETRIKNIRKEFRRILEDRSVLNDEIDKWERDCLPSISADIRKEAVWINRSKFFDHATKKLGETFGRESVWDLLGMVFDNKEIYIAPEKDEHSENEEGEKYSSNADSDSKDFAIKARGWLSKRWGSGKKSDTVQVIDNLNKITEALVSNDFTGSDGLQVINRISEFLSGKTIETSNPIKEIKDIVGWGTGRDSTGSMALKKVLSLEAISPEAISELVGKIEKEITDKSKNITNINEPIDWITNLREEIEREIGLKYKFERDHIGEFSVMLDHAARRISSGHTWIKKAEASRRGFDVDSQKIKEVPENTRLWLDAYRVERGGKSGSIDEYIIRKRAIGGWKEVVHAWAEPEITDEEDRITAARLLQDSGEIDKFGDIQLFEALATDDAKCVWFVDEKPDHKPLLYYVDATVANYKKKQFKVPAYRHPDPLLHPVFCDFGDSRWKAEYEVHKRHKTALNSSPKKSKVENKLNTITLGLYDGNSINDTNLIWSSKLLTKDLSINQNDSDNNIEVTRNSRLGRASANAKEPQTVKIMNVFDEKNWNARLQAPREQLEDISKRLKSNNGKWDEKTEKLKNGIKWFISFSPRMIPSGPWVDYAKKHQLNITPKYYKNPANEGKREKSAKHLFSRLHGLRVLSVDLGHRYAAACAVWETISTSEMEHLCSEYSHPKPSREDLFLHLKKKAKKGSKEFDETTIYRRIGNDTLPDGAPHPAPWARLDRQFLIKLQGEDEKPRRASDEEINYFSAFEKEIGYKSSDEQVKRIDKLTSHAVDIARLGIKRHADFARIAHNLITNEKQLSGGRTEPLTDEKRIELLTDTLITWHSLSNKKWDCPKAVELWDTHIIPLLFGVTLPGDLDEDEIASAQARKKRAQMLAESLQPAAEILAGDEKKRHELSSLWRSFWNEEDAKWKTRLHNLRDRILPRGIYGYEQRENGSYKRILKNKEKLAAARHVGGLSIDRIAIIKSLYQVQKAFFTRLTPDGRQIEKDINGNPTGEFLTAGEDFGRRALEDLERLRENRVKQLASRIAEAALGIGRMPEKEKYSEKDTKTNLRRENKRPRERKDAPCHAVIIENLENYRPEEIRTRRENRQLMSWSSSKVFKYLSEACELHGLHLRQVPAGYTSRQDSRTGAPGVRCSDVSIKYFISGSVFWHKEILRAEKRRKDKKADARDEWILSLYDYWKEKDKDEKIELRSVRIPHNGGEIFVSADSGSPCAKGIQADLNAAANIGLRALLDPDWPGKWWYIPCEASSFKPKKDNVGGCLAMDTATPLITSVAQEERASSSKKRKKETTSGTTKEVVNLWRDVSAAPIEPGNWRRYSEYKEDVLKRVIESLETHEIYKREKIGE